MELIDLEIRDYRFVLLYSDFFAGCLFPREGSGDRDHLSREKQRLITRRFIRFLMRSLTLKHLYLVPRTSFLSEKLISPCALIFEDGEGEVLIMQGTTTL